LLLLLEFLSLLLLHAAVLEPDLDLRLVEAERGGDLDAARARQVAVEVELLLQLGQLLVGEVRSAEVRRRLQRLAMSETVVCEMRQLIVLRLDVQRAVFAQQLDGCTVKHTNTKLKLCLMGLLTAFTSSSSNSSSSLFA